MSETDEKGAGEETRHDPAAPHTAPFPTHVPRWLAWLLLAAFAATGVLCARAVLH